MAESTPVIQVLAKNNYADQHLISLPSGYPLPPLGPSSLRIKSSILSLTTNNLTYAMIGHLLGWWDVHPLPPSIPAEFSDPQKYGRISAWGYGVVVESNVSDIKTGSLTYGYLPIGTLPMDMAVQMDSNVPGQFVEVSKHRENLMPIYNRYRLAASIATPLTVQDKQGLAYDSLFRVLFETGYMMNRFVFAWEPAEHIHPFTADDGWAFEDGQLTNNTIVLIFSPSGKTALSFANQLKTGRPAKARPGAVVGIGSDASRAFTQGTDLYDHVLSYTQDPRDLSNVLDLKEDTKIVLCDFGARGGAADRWAEALRKSHENVIVMGIGGELAPVSNEEATKNFLERGQKGAGLKNFRINASGLRSQAFEAVGQRKYDEDCEAEWRRWKEAGLVKGLEVVWGAGMDDFGKAWSRLCNSGVSPAEGLVFSLD